MKGAFVKDLKAITVATWVKSRVIPTNRGFLRGLPPAGGFDRYFGMRYDAYGMHGGGVNIIKVGLMLSDDSTVWSEYESASNVQTTDWQHVAMTWSSGNNIKLYVNGVLDVPTSIGSVCVGSIKKITHLDVGRGVKDYSNSSGGWNGLIDDFRIYSVALKQAELQALIRKASTIRK